ncbi:unnamed protein product [Bemisia tabaci]|uniref:Ionotropic receptor n=1 Tax=Bemisia tabaci TaxID=7038 RepID=A0A9P0EZY8_BEMTA|nr:unnamed protein product [Bemisia tabaci]
MKMVVEKMGGFFFETGFPEDVQKDFRKALKRDINMMIFENSLEDTDFRHLDVITLLDHGEISFMVPDRGFMPSYLTPAKCFSVTVWYFILIVLILFMIVYEIYKRLCVKIYTEATEGISTAFTIFSYCLCVAQSRLLLNSLTGRILFIVFTFTFMILSTVFLSLMTTFFSEKVRYTPFNTHTALKDSDVIFQLMLDENESFSFMDDPSYEWLKERSSHSMYKLIKELRDTGNTMVCYSPERDEVSQIGDYWNVSEFTVKGIWKNLATIIINHGFIFFLPYSAKNHDLISVTSSYTGGLSYDFHMVKEPIMSYPFDMRLMRGSLYGDKIKAYVARFVEAGILKEIYEMNQVLQFNRIFRQFEDDKNAPPKAFNMADLRLAFIILIFGNLSSSFVFMVELLYSI